MTPQPSHSGLLLAMRYQVGEAMGMGALSAVYRGLDTVLHRSVVVKAVPPEHVPTYRKALQEASALTHPAIVATFDAIELDGWLFLVQEFVTARSLNQYLVNGVPSTRALDLAAQLSRALAYAHGHQVTHGDLTPAAILVDRRAVVRINNFALPADLQYFSRVAGTIPGETGNAAMMAADGIPSGTAGDVWAVGLLLWQLLSAPTAQGSPVTADIAPAGLQRREFRADVGEDVRELVRRCIRPQHPHPIEDAESLALALELEAHALAGLHPRRREITPPALHAARESVASLPSWSTEDTQGTPRGRAQPADAEAAEPWQGGSKTPAAPVSEQPAGRSRLATQERLGQPRLRLPSLAASAAADSSRQPDAVSELPPRGASASERAAFQKARVQLLPTDAETGPDRDKTSGGGLTVRVMVLLGATLFLLAFVVGFFLASLLGQH